MPVKVNKPCKRQEQYILDNLRYDPYTGHLWWTKTGGSRRKMNLPAGHKHFQGYVEVTIRFDNKQYRILGHRIAWFLYYGRWPDRYMDHINNDRSDNRIVNLREATPAQNNSNRAKGSKIYSAQDSKKFKVHPVYVGVRQIPSGNWIARIKTNHIGTFKTPEEAALAYNEKAKEIYGDFANLNVIDKADES